MAPKPKFDKKDIIDAAFAIAQEKGLSGITARNVANYLGCSVAPIYVNFKTIDDLIKAVVERVVSISNTLLTEQKGSSIFENIGKASLEFARKYPVFLRELIMRPNPYMSSYDQVEKSLIKTLAQDKSFAGWTIEERRRLLLKVRVFQIGLSVMVANGHLPSWFDDRALETIFLEIGEELVLAQNIKKGE